MENNPSTYLKISRRTLFRLLLFVMIFNYLPALCQENVSIYRNVIKKGTRIYVVTNRAMDSSAATLQFSNHIKPTASLTFAEATFQNPDSITVTLQDSSRFLSETLATPGDWVLFVHGNGKTFMQAVQRGLDIQYLYDVNVIVFSWPSFEPDIDGFENLQNSQQHINKTVDHFRELLHFLVVLRQSDPWIRGDAKLSLFAHSLGNYYLKSLVSYHLADGLPEGLFDNLILNEAAVNQDNHKQWVEQLSFQKRIYIISNKNDFTLKGVRVFTDEGKQLGEIAEPPLAENAVYIQFAEAVGIRFPLGRNHTYFIGDIPDGSYNIARFYNSLMHGKPADLDDTGLFRKKENGLGYDILMEPQKE